LLDLCSTYGIQVLLDVHALKDSQNGYDNSGKASGFEWIDETHFKHWGIQDPEWMGHWNGEIYDSINFDNLIWAVDNVKNLLDLWGNHPAVFALQPVNEPWEHSDIPVLKDFYRVTRQLMREFNPELTFVFHDAFHTSGSVWNDLFEDTEKIALDTHIYMAWETPKTKISEFCEKILYFLYNEDSLSIKYDMWVGEWSLATDECGMWLDGMNDE